MFNQVTGVMRQKLLKVCYFSLFRHGGQFFDKTLEALKPIVCAQHIGQLLFPETSKQHAFSTILLKSILKKFV